MSDHSLLSASSSSRWLACPVSVTGRDADTAGEAAAEGTALHKVSEDVLCGQPYPEIGTVLEASGYKFAYTEDRHADTKAYVDFILSLPWIGPYSVEGRVHYGITLGTPHNLSFGTSDCYGFTADSEGPILDIVDLKAGRTYVSPAENPQAILYAAGVLEGLLPLKLPLAHRVRVTIFQPRLSKKPNSWMTTVGRIEEALRQMRPAAQAAVRFYHNQQTAEDSAVFPEHTGDHCKYCKRKSDCTAFKRAVQSIAQPGKTVQFDPAVFALRDVIRGYLDDMEKLAFDAAIKGTPFPGTKLKLGRKGNPALVATQDQIREQAKQLGIESAVVWTEEVWATPAKTRDAFKRAGMKDEQIVQFVRSPNPKPMITDASDPAPEYVVRDLSVFTSVAQ